MSAYAIILAGGSGKRLWPLSTPVLPKQFASRSAPELLPLIGRVARRKNTESVLKKDYPPLRKISFDYAVMQCRYIETGNGK